MFRLFALSLAALVVTAVSTATAADKAKDATHGVVASVSESKITLKMHKEEKSFDLAASVKVTNKGSEGKMADVKAGEHVELTVADGKVTAIAIVEPKPKK